MCGRTQFEFEKKIFIGCKFRSVHGRLLESRAAFSFRTSLAALATGDNPSANLRPLAAAAYAADMKVKTWGDNAVGNFQR